MHQEISFKNFEISWEEPPRMTGERQVNIASVNPDLQAMLEAATGSKGAHVVGGATVEDAIKNAKSLIEKIV